MFERTQSGWTLYLWISALPIAIVILVGALADVFMVVPLIVAVIVLAIVGSVVARLTVTVGAESVVAAFGWGWPRRSIRFDDITAVQPVRNRWWHGWGIRWIGNGWMYNVAGYDAVELELRSGKRFRIGTDRPAELTAAIRSRLA